MASIQYTLPPGLESFFKTDTHPHPRVVFFISNTSSDKDCPIDFRQNHLFACLHAPSSVG